MDNRFGFKDFVLSILMMVMIVSFWLGRIQYDRQWEQLRQLQNGMAQQKDQLKQIRQQLARGVQLAHGTRGSQPAQTPGAHDAQDPFGRLRQARQASDFAEGDWFIYPFGSTVGKLTPLVSADVYQSIIQSQVIESLAVRDPQTLQWKPWLARRWTVSDDGLTFTFEIRPEARFSDGTPLTAEDVVFSYDWIMNPKIAAPRDRAYYSKLASVRSTGKYTVVFTLKEAYFKGFDICAGLGILSKHFYSQFTEEQFNQLPGLLFGSGPYKLAVDPKAWKPGTGKVQLVRNDRYWGVSPALDRIIFREITDDTARLVSFRNGELDRYSPTPEQYLALKKDPTLKKQKQLFEYETITGGYRYLAWNQFRDGKPTRFADRRVRLAMTLLTNRKQMARKLMVGLATPTSSPFHRLGPQADPDVKLWPYDPQHARQLLKEAGFEDRDGDGIIESASGEPFVFKLIYPASSHNYQQMAFYLKDAYARVGIVMQPDPLEWTIMLQRIGQRQFDAMSLGWSGSIEGDPYQIFHSDQVADGGDNYVHYINKKLDRLIDKARVTMDEAKRMKIWHQVHRILHEDQPYTFLWTSRAVLFVDKRFRNIQRVKTGLNGVEEWYVPRSLQRWTQ